MLEDLNNILHEIDTIDPEFAYELLELMAWDEANLEFILRPAQKQIREKIFNWDGFKFFIKCSRRLGKSFLLCTLSWETCLGKEGARVRYGSGTLDALLEIVQPINEILYDRAPEHLRPIYLPSRKRWIFKNGSQIVTTGLDINPDRLRGPWCDLFIIDEGGAVKRLKYIISDIAMPQFLDVNKNIVKGRKLIVAGTPPRTPAHEFTELTQLAAIEGNLYHATIYEADYPPETIEIFKKEAGGENSSTWKREYLAQDVVDENYAIVPEWDSSFVEEPVHDDLFQFHLKYESIDIGVRDLTVCLFAHYNFKKATLYIDDEFVINGPKMTTKAVADGIKAIEPVVFEGHELYRRISDCDLLLVQDLSYLHQLPFQATDKGSLEEMVNEMRIWVKDGRVRVHPKCKVLVGSLAYGVWNERRKEWERTPAYGHFDALAALMYLIRNVNTQHNPIPRNYGKREEDIFTVEETDAQGRWKKAFNHPKKGARR